MPGSKAKAAGCKDLGFEVRPKILALRPRPRPNITDWSGNL